MRRSPAGFLAGLLCGAGALFAFRRRLLHRRRKPASPTVDPAEELKRKLEESRATPPEAERASDPEPAPPAQPEATLDDRRREVHDRGRSAIERMRGDPPQP
jgi:hypothetical protein